MENRHGTPHLLALRIIAVAFALALHTHFASAGDAVAIDWSKAEMVSVRLIDDRFVPDKLRFRVGTLYRLRLENAGTLFDDSIERLLATVRRD